MPKNSKAISCKNVWKLYGSNPSKYLASKNFSPTIKDLKESQYIPAVFNASIDVYEGEILVIMGLSGSQNGHGFPELCVDASQKCVRQYCFSFGSSGY